MVICKRIVKNLLKIVLIVKKMDIGLKIVIKKKTLFALFVKNLDILQRIVKKEEKIELF